MVSGRHQHPLAIDGVCAFMPELTIVMAHGGEHWRPVRQAAGEVAEPAHDDLGVRPEAQKMFFS